MPPKVAGVLKKVTIILFKIYLNQVTLNAKMKMADLQRHQLETFI